jgi:hypothetical protein
MFAYIAQATDNNICSRHDLGHIVTSGGITNDSFKAKMLAWF